MCLTTSYVAHQHFAVNDDGKGMERGLLTYDAAMAHMTDVSIKAQLNAAWAEMEKAKNGKKK